MIIYPRHLKIASAFFTNVAAAWFVAFFVSRDFWSLIFNAGWFILRRKIMDLTSNVYLAQIAFGVLMIATVLVLMFGKYGPRNLRRSAIDRRKR